MYWCFLASFLSCINTFRPHWLKPHSLEMSENKSNSVINAKEFKAFKWLTGVVPQTVELNEWLCAAKVANVLLEVSPVGSFQVSLTSVMFAPSIYFCIFAGQSDLLKATVPPKLIGVNIPFFLWLNKTENFNLARLVTLNLQKKKMWWIFQAAGSLKL